MPVATFDDPVRETVRARIRSGAEMSVPYLAMNALATVIACYGLFANSPAVVIGAMIVAMLLGPITGIGLALVESDIAGLLRALWALLAGALCVIVTALILGLIHRNIPITNEILARTAPNLLDLMIALAGGAAGAYATVSPRLSVAFIGVAIATALVPPLASAGILFARGEYALGGGAFLLAFTNMVAIQFASSTVLWLTGYRRLVDTPGLGVKSFVKRNAVSLGILAILALLLERNLQQVIAQQLFETQVRGTLTRLIGASPGSNVIEVRFAAGEAATIVRAVMRGPRPPTADDVAALAARLPIPPNRTSIDLRVRFVETTIITPHGPIYADQEFDLGE